MLTLSHASHDTGELLEVRTLRRDKWDAFEERNHGFEQCSSFANDVHECSIPLAVRLDVATTEPFVYQLEHLSPVAVLTDMKLGHKLKPDAACSIALHRDREASFSVDVSRDVAVQPFLLIVRTRHVVTTVNVRSDVTMSSAGFSEFPAYGRI